MSKYVIDLPDNCSWVQWVMTSDKDGHAYFDFLQPLELTPLDDELEEAYKKGLNNAWACAKRIAMTKTADDCPNFTIAELEKIFGCSTIQNVFDAYSASEAIEKVKAYEEKKKADSEIKVGDEVESLHTGRTFIIHEIDGELVKGYNFTSRLTCYNNKFDFKKTGRYFPEVADLLKKISEVTE